MSALCLHQTRKRGARLTGNDREWVNRRRAGPPIVHPHAHEQSRTLSIVFEPPADVRAALYPRRFNRFESSGGLRVASIRAAAIFGLTDVIPGRSRAGRVNPAHAVADAYSADILRQ